MNASPTACGIVQYLLAQASLCALGCTPPLEAICLLLAVPNRLLLVVEQTAFTCGSEVFNQHLDRTYTILDIA